MLYFQIHIQELLDYQLYTMEIEKNIHSILSLNHSLIRLYLFCKYFLNKSISTIINVIPKNSNHDNHNGIFSIVPLSNKTEIVLIILNTNKVIHISVSLIIANGNNPPILI